MSRIPGPGETFGRYQLERELGHGGMGVVHAALDTVLGRRVALKIVAPHLARDEEFRTRFAREAATQARLDSPHVVRIYDHGEHDGILYISTQLVDGVDLASLVADRGALDPALAVGVTEQLLAGLADAHRAQVVHRDVKPANVLVTAEGAAYLCDFGIATMAGQGLTRTGQVIGSLPWMAPERHYGQEAGAAGDLYSAGCLLWFALTGAAPFVGSDGEVMRGHLDGEVPQLVGTTPFARQVNAILLKALAKEPEQRYASAEAMAADLRALDALAPAAVLAAEAAPTTIRSAATRPATGAGAAGDAARVRRPWAVPALVAASLLAAVAGGLGVRTLTSDDAALVAGATTVEVGGRTVTMQPTPTLSPLGATRAGAAGAGAAGGVAGGVTGGVVGADVGVDGLGVGGGVGAAGATPGTTGGSTSGSTSGGTAASTRAAAPAYTYSCWDGSLTTTSCSYPIHADGADWMFPSTQGWSCMAQMPYTGSSNGVHDSYRCGYSGGTGPNAIYLMRMSSSTQARNWLVSVMDRVETENPWSDGYETAGRSLLGPGTTKDGKTQYRWGRYWSSDGDTWMAFINASTASARNDGIGKLTFRALRYVRGEPCSVSARC